MEIIWRIIPAVLLGASAGSLVFLLIRFIGKRRVLKSVPDEPRIDILRKYIRYESDDVIRHTTTIVLNSPVPDILLKYNYAERINKEFDTEDDIVFALLDFVCDNFRHDSNTAIRGNGTLVGVIKSYEQMGSKTNCRGLSLILAELLRINGIRARHVTCKPYEEPFSDCHVVVDCILPSGARIMLDPTYRLYLTDDSGNYVSIARFREGIIDGRRFYANSDASYNGGDFDLDDYIEYMTKNLFRFNANYMLNDTDQIRTEIALIPCGYSVKGFTKLVQYTTDPNYFWNME